MASQMTLFFVVDLGKMTKKFPFPLIPAHGQSQMKVDYSLVQEIESFLFVRFF